MAGINNITIAGRLTRVPELRFIQSGDAVVSFSIAYNERKLDKATNQWVDGEPLFLKVEAWRQLAEGAADELTQGDTVVVSGVLKPDNWEKDGKKRESVKIVANDIAKTVRARKQPAAQQEPVW